MTNTWSEHINTITAETERCHLDLRFSAPHVIQSVSIKPKKEWTLGNFYTPVSDHAGWNKPNTIWVTWCNVMRPPEWTNKLAFDIYANNRKEISKLLCELTGTDFQKKVLVALSKIPFGETRTYQQIAQAIGHPKAHRAVASACKKNPLPIVIPCHRVVPSSGGIGKYAYGVNMKKKLLESEGVDIASL